MMSELSRLKKLCGQNIYIRHQFTVLAMAALKYRILEATLTLARLEKRDLVSDKAMLEAHRTYMFEKAALVRVCKKHGYKVPPISVNHICNAFA